MKRFQYRLILRHAALVLVCCAVLNPAFGKSPKSYSFYLQPWQNAAVYVNEKKILPEILEKNNSLALFRIGTEGTDSFKLRIENSGFMSFETAISLKTEEDRFRENSNYLLYQLRKKENRFRLRGYWPSGKEPKSVNFISNTRVILPLLDGNAFDVMNVETGKTERISIPGHLSLKNGFVESLVIPERNELWLSQMTTASVHVFTLDSLQLKRTIKLSGNWSKVLAYDAARKQVYCSNWISRDVSVIDAENYKELYRISTGAVPRGMILSDDGKFLYVTQFSRTLQSEGDGRIIKVDLAGRKISKVIGANGSKRHIVGDNNYYYVSDMAHARVEVYSRLTDRLVKNIPVFSKPNTIVLSPDGRHLYVSCRGPNNPAGYELRSLQMGQIHVVDTSRLQVIDSWEAGNQSTGLDISPDGRYLVSSDFKDDRIRIYEKVLNAD